MHQADLLEQEAKAAPRPGSPALQRGSDGAALRAHAPTASEAANVSEFLTSRGLSEVAVGPHNLFVSARGTVSQVQAALNVELHNYRLGTHSYFSNTAKPVLPSQVQSLVSYVGGLNDIRPKPMIVRPVDPDGKYARTKISAQPNGLFFSAGCFRAPQTVNFTSSAADATYTGNRYGADITNSDLGTLPPCGYQPSEIQTAYGMDKLYKFGFDGRGQTVAIVDAFGSMTIQQDITTFSAAMGLPPATGDSGDESINLGFANADWPASSPWVTAVGGISLALRKNNQIAFQTAWGNNLTMIADAAPGNPPLDPVFNEGFVFGGGGGVSDVYAKPWFQHRLPGNRRRVPDISWLADPYTGVEIVITGDSAGDQFVGVIGGTSLSCPMFSGLWAIASQGAGHKLGQAAARLYNLPPFAITDVDGLTSPNNVSGDITDAVGDSPEVASDLAAPLQNLPDFYSALYNSPFSTRWFVITFGTDSTLPANNGYDLATGLGTPNPAAFVSSLAH